MEEFDMTMLTAVADDVSSLALDWKAVCMRLLCAMVVGLVIGTEREYTHRPAGMRTHILVALGACAVMVTGQLIFVQYKPFGGSPDPARLAAQVITGVGFLGAGTILREGINVKGLTTAASLWSVACLGIAAGGGYYAVALVGMVFIFVTLTIFEWIQNSIIKPKTVREYTLESTDITSTLETIGSLADKNHCTISGIRAENQDGIYVVTFKAQFSPGKKWPRKFFEGLSKEPATRVVVIADDIVSV